MYAKDERRQVMQDSVEHTDNYVLRAVENVKVN